MREMYELSKSVRQVSHRCCPVVVVCGIIALVAGCGQRGPELIKVTGVVTIDGAAPSGPGKIFFNPLQSTASEVFRPATAAFDATGQFVASTFKPEDGLPPGKYGVAVKCWEVPPTMGGPPPKSLIAEKYFSISTSGLELTVEQGSEPIELKYDLLSR